MGLLQIGNKHLGRSCVKSVMREPLPAAIITAWYSMIEESSTLLEKKYYQYFEDREINGFCGLYLLVHTQKQHKQQ